MQIVGKQFTHEQFEHYVNALSLAAWHPKFVVVHNTSSPDVALYKTWEARQGRFKDWTPEQWLRNLASFYSGQGWNAAPHLFIPPTPDTILVLSPLGARGTHTPSWNAISWGVETVGEFEREQFAGTPSHDNLVAALAVLHRKAGLWPNGFQLGVSGLHFHKEDKRTTHRTCPGKNMIKADLVRDVLIEMNSGGAAGDHVDVPVAVHEADTGAMSEQELTSVSWLQLQLNRWDKSLGLTVDGILGTKKSKTRGAVRKFQQAMNLTVDGIPGPITRRALKAAVG